MFEDSFLPNLLIFAAGQGAAWGYLRTGLVPRGLALMVGGWVLADLALLARLAYEAHGLFWVSLLAMQLYSLVEVVLFTGGRIRRRSPARRGEREVLYRRAFVHYLGNELGPAARIYRQLLRRDPWDVDAKLSLASLLARDGDPRRARSLLRGARALDREDRYGDLIELELQRFQVR